jgi:hypothetical protein
MKTSLWRWGRYATLAFLLVTIFACSVPRGLPLPAPQPTATLEVPLKPTPTPLPTVTVTFKAHVPEGEGEVVLAVLDEVTGINIVPQRYPMKRVASGLYEVEVPAAVGSVSGRSSCDCLSFIRSSTPGPGEGALSSMEFADLRSA